MGVLKKKSVAVLVSIAMVVLSLACFGGSKLKIYRAEVLEIFTEGEEGNELILGVEHDLEKRIEHANDLLAFAGEYLPEDNALMLSVKSAVNELEKAKDPAEKYSANEQLGAACNELNDYVYSNCTLKAAHKKYSGRNYFLSPLEGDNSRMEDSAALYNSSAEEFNSKLASFPGIVVRLLSFTKPLALFR